VQQARAEKQDAEKPVGLREQPEPAARVHQGTVQEPAEQVLAEFVATQCDSQQIQIDERIP